MKNQGFSYLDYYQKTRKMHFVDGWSICDGQPEWSGDSGSHVCDTDAF